MADFEFFSYATDTTENADNQNSKKSGKFSFSAELLDWLEILTFAVIAVVIVFTLIFRIVTIDGSSMENTLFENDRVIISNLLYKAEVGDVVVISRNIENNTLNQDRNHSPIIKRVIAVAGQTVDIDFSTATVFVDGKALKEEYISSPTFTSSDVNFPLYVPEGYVFVMGDNRMASLDSRDSRIGEGGLIDTRYILGHAIFKVFPFDRIGKVN